MKTGFAILVAVGAASTASAQAWDIEFSEPVLSPEVSSTRVTLSFEPAASDYALGGIAFDVHAGEAGWSDLEALISHPGQKVGVIDGGSVLGATAGFLWAFGYEPTPGRVGVWAGQFTVTDFAVREIGITTETDRYEAYGGPFGPGPRPLPSEGHGTIRVVPAPAGVALLGLGGLVAAGRRRRGEER